MARTFTFFGKTNMRIVRLYADNDGESHFEEVEIDLTLTDYAPPAPPLHLAPPTTAIRCGFMQAPSGWSSDWHPSPARNMFFVSTGEWEVTASDGETRRFGGGSILLVEDTRAKGHSSRVIGEVDSLAALVQLED